MKFMGGWVGGCESRETWRYGRRKHMKFMAELQVDVNFVNLGPMAVETRELHGIFGHVRVF